jgi:hypothetical protein
MQSLSPHDVQSAKDGEGSEAAFRKQRVGTFHHRLRCIDTR